MIAQVNYDHAGIYKLKTDSHMETEEKTEPCFSNILCIHNFIHPLSVAAYPFQRHWGSGADPS